MTSSLGAVEKGQVTLTIEVSVAETEKYLQRAADRLSQKTSIPGFRPGRAPLSVIKQRFGEMAVYEEATQDIIAHTFWEALKEHALETVGQPDIQVQKMAPGNPITYTATVALLPAVTLAAWDTVQVKRNAISVSDTDVEALVDDLRGMQAKEQLVDRAAATGDKVEIDFEVKQDGVMIEGGSGSKYPLIIGKGGMIPGFEEEVVGMTAGATKEFMLTFPNPYFQESLAGKQATFKVSVRAVYSRVLPEKNDAWATSMIGKPLADLRTLLSDNVKHEKEQKEAQRVEGEVVEQILHHATFGDIPDLMISSEVKKMLYELEDDVKQRGMEWDRYLGSIKKTKEQLEKEFVPQAERRVKAALVLRTLAHDLKLQATEEEIQRELDAQRESYTGNDEALQNISSDEFRRYVGVTLTNRKVLEALVKRLVVES